MIYKSILIIIFLGTPLASSSQWSFEVLNNGFQEYDSTITFPITYDHGDCRFRFQVNNMGQTDNVTIINAAGCNVNNHFLVIDDYQYQLPFKFEMNILEDQWLIDGTVNLGNCSTTSGDPILTALPRLSVESNQFQITSGNSNNVYVIDSITYFVFNSANSDIICSQGTVFNNPLNLIFIGAFE